MAGSEIGREIQARTLLDYDSHSEANARVRPAWERGCEGESYPQIGAD